MRTPLHLGLQAILWALAPVLNDTGLMDSPSLLVMPLSAALAAVASRGWRGGLGAPAAGLGLAVLGYSAWTLASGRATPGEAASFAAGIVPFHLLGTWLLVGLFWWSGRRVRAARAPAA